ncbi:MAG: family 78 glycoside hydrolase catalytic domain, partial [Tannerella sp.]|nr:family 78 glycoside hydrolase catalytic domain [Tannerella sp.]
MKMVFIFLAVLINMEISAAVFSVTRLSCEQVTNPLGVDTRQPLLSWQLESQENNTRQSAYEIIVSHDKTEIDRDIGNAWTTGKIHSGESVFIPYGGAPLQPFTRYYWKVRIYNQNGTPSPWSAAAWFETAMLDASDWTAQWIGDGSKQFTRDEDFYQDDAMPLFRKSFSVRKTVTSARLYICGLGYYEASLNGRKVGDNLLDPGWTAHKKQALYVVHDVTGLLQRGANAAGVMLGNGWYNPLPIRLFRRFNLRDHQQTGRPVVKAQLLIRYADGTSEVIGTDDTWKTTPGPVVRNNVYLGEHYDARREVKDWNKAGISDSQWKNAVPCEGPSGMLTVQMQPAVKLGEVVKPVRIYEQKPGVYIVDMGKNFAGVARIHVKGAAGANITIRYGENIHPDGSLNWYTTTAGHIKSMWNLTGGPGAPSDAIQEDRYILKGEGKETYAPRFTFHGFRYLEISGWPGKPDLKDIEGLRLHAALPNDGAFACSNEMFNRLHEVTLRTFMSNVFSVQSDCPGREKMGYGGDMVATAESFIFNYDMGNFYRKTVRDFVNDQTVEGGMTAIAPYTGISDSGFDGESGVLGWQLAFPYLQKQLYDFYGDVRIIENCYPAFVRQMEFYNART